MFRVIVEREIWTSVMHDAEVESGIIDRVAYKYSTYVAPFNRVLFA